MTAMKRFLPIILAASILSACGTSRTHLIDTSDNRNLKPWQKPYEYDGERYTPLLNADGFVENGLASWYGSDFHGKYTSNGERYDMYAMTAAHKTLPLGVFVRVTNKRNDREIVVRVNDRGPFVRDRVIDLSFSAAKQLDIVGSGTAPVRVEVLGYGDYSKGNVMTYRRPATLDGGRYAVQVAAFGEAENASRLAARMKERYGYSVVQEATVKGGKFFRVQAGRYDTLHDAEEARSRFEKDGYAGCFVVACD